MPKTQINPLYSTLETIGEEEDLTPYQLLTMSPSVLKYFPLARLLAVAAACAWEDITGKPSTYPPETHTHAQYLESVAWSIITGKPSTYPPETHNHDSAYAALAEAAKHLKYSHAEWVGNTTSASQRTINLAGDVEYAKIIIVLGAETVNNDHVFISFWSTGYGVNTVGFRWGETWTPYYFINLNTFYAAPDTTEGILSLYSEHWNYDSLGFRAFVWGI